MARLDEITRAGLVVTPNDVNVSAMAYATALRPDPAGRWGIGLLVALAGATAAIGGNGAVAAGWAWTGPRGASPEFWPLATAIGVELAVSALGVIDLVMVRRDLRKRSGGTTLAVIRDADRAFEQRRLPEAIEKYGQVLARWPSHLGSLNNRALALSAVGRGDIAIAMLTQAIGRWPDPAVVAVLHLNRGSCFLDRRQYARALADYRMAIALEPQEARHRAARASLYVRTRRYVDALRDLNAAIALSPGPAGAPLLLTRASVLDELGETDRARTDLDRAISLSPDLAEARVTRARLRLAAKDVSGAVDDATSALTSSPDHTGARLLRVVGRLAADLDTTEDLITLRSLVTASATVQTSDHPLLFSVGCSRRPSRPTSRAQWRRARSQRRTVSESKTPPRASCWRWQRTGFTERVDCPRRASFGLPQHRLLPPRWTPSSAWRSVTCFSAATMRPRRCCRCARSHRT